MAASRDQLMRSMQEISKDLMQLSNASNDNSDIMDVALSANAILQDFLKPQQQPQSSDPLIDDLQRRAGVK